jgi:hypothetical protein
VVLELAALYPTLGVHRSRDCSLLALLTVRLSISLIYWSLYTVSTHLYVAVLLTLPFFLLIARGQTFLFLIIIVAGTLAPKSYMISRWRRTLLAGMNEARIRMSFF